MAINTNTKLFNHNGYITTFKGNEVYLPNPTVEMIDISDIAKSLSNICHWNGHTRSPFTVAQHSVMVCWISPDHLKKMALLHDAAEAYLGDVCKPLKVLLGSVFAEMEERFNKIIFDKFGLFAKNLPLIKEYDHAIQKMEWEALFENHSQHIRDFLALRLPISNGHYIWSHEVSEILFLKEYDTLFKS